jgi:hypothetical protein
MRALILYDRFEMKDALALVERLLPKFELLGMETLSTKSWLLCGAVLKSLGRVGEAARAFSKRPAEPRREEASIGCRRRCCTTSLTATF